MLGLGVAEGGVNDDDATRGRRHRGTRRHCRRRGGRRANGRGWLKDLDVALGKDAKPSAAFALVPVVVDTVEAKWEVHV